MQTFLPYSNFSESAEVLDDRRLGKQRVECKQIFSALTVPVYGWKNHPATRMWRGYEAALVCYSIDICREWRARGFQDSLLPYFLDLYDLFVPRVGIEWPFWLGDDDLHISHQSNLIRKDPAYYGPLFPGVPGDLPYIWPVRS